MSGRRKPFDREAMTRELAKMEPWLLVGEAVTRSGIGALEPHRRQAHEIAALMDRMASEIGDALGFEVEIWAERR